ncbi:hypothetical protein [Flavobacterium frigidarium]|uniref:hypothetical protein n=1 Tax=Flavobacterium frigidarium TaxID=99286 RepID=UPI0030D8ECBE|tara:strand:+ start:8604 stop:8951 length:348 start_codon:yes stop_codon:yes gene_type:complete
MEINLTITGSANVNQIDDDATGYYLISKRWTMINDSNITFVRIKGLGYCYNAHWAGPSNKLETKSVSSKSKNTIMVSHALIKSFFVNQNGELVLPNTSEIRSLIGFNRSELQLAN